MTLSCPSVLGKVMPFVRPLLFIAVPRIIDRTESPSRIASLNLLTYNAPTPSARPYLGRSQHIGYIQPNVTNSRHTRQQMSQMCGM